jgi:hypothetical protein
MKVDYIGCPAGGHRIREFQPDICLKKHNGSEMRFYHNRCAQESQRIIATEGETTWSLTRERVFWDLDGGAA